MLLADPGWRENTSYFHITHPKNVIQEIRREIISEKMCYGRIQKNNIVPRINGAPEYSVQKLFPSTQINRKIVDNENCFMCILFFTLQRYVFLKFYGGCGSLWMSP